VRTDDVGTLTRDNRNQPSAPLVSVIIPAFNAETTIAAAVESLQRQDHDRWQAVVIDDGSTDRTRQIAEGLASGDRRVQVVTQANQGVAAARNLGVEQAQGKYTLLLDADDTLRPGGLAAMVKQAEAAADNRAGSYGDFVMTDPSGTPLLLQIGRHPVVTIRELLTSVFFAVHAVLTPTALARQVPFDRNLRVIEDTDWFLKLGQLGCSWHRSEAVVANYCIRPESRSGDFRQMLECTRSVYAAAYARHGKTDDAALDTLLAKAAVSYATRQFVRARLMGGDAGPALALLPAIAADMRKSETPPLPGAVLGHLSAAACAMGGCRAVSLDQQVTGPLAAWWGLVCGATIAVPTGAHEAAAAFAGRVHTLQQWVASHTDLAKH
jgi:CTP:molybdopterin cytidylyltransferase MocA